jgi:hypothetical protein
LSTLLWRSFSFWNTYFVINEEKPQISYITVYGRSHHQNDTQSLCKSLLLFCFLFLFCLPYSKCKWPDKSKSEINQGYFYNYQYMILLTWIFIFAHIYAKEDPFCTLSFDILIVLDLLVMEMGCCLLDIYPYPFFFILKYLLCHKWRKAPNFLHYCVWQKPSSNGLQSSEEPHTI